jgi:hypothetical protein
MDNLGQIEILIAAFGLMLTLTQALALFILSDIRTRLTRLETRAMKGKGP